MESFSQTESITRRLTGTVWIITLFFVVSLAGVYFSSQSLLQKLTDLHQTNQVYDLTRQINLLVSSLSDTLERFSHNQDSKQSVLSLRDHSVTQEQDLFSKALNLSARNLQIDQQFLRARSSVDDFNRATTDFLDGKIDILFIQQFELEAHEQLTKVQIIVKEESDRIFENIYNERFRPLMAGAGFTLLFVCFSLAMGFSLIRRINTAISNLLRTTKAIGDGNFTVRASIVNPDEIGALTYSFNQMVEKIETTTVSKDALAIANKELEAFSYSVSHDLRAPLRGIDGFSLALIEDLGPKLDNNMKDYLHRIRAGVQKMGGLIDDLLNLSKFSRQALVIKSVDISKLAAEVFQEIQELEPERKVDFKNCESSIVNADAGLIRALLENLLNNAWKYTSKVASSKIEFGVIHGENQKTFFVKDNGAGFDMAYYHILFGAFQRLHKPEDFPGTGVGLATVQRIVVRHGGKIWAESAVDQGATFFFTLADNLVITSKP